MIKKYWNIIKNPSVNKAYTAQSSDAQDEGENDLDVKWQVAGLLQMKRKAYEE